MSEKVKPKKPIGTRNKTTKKTRSSAKKRTYLNPDVKPLFIPALKQAMVESPLTEEDIVSVKSEYELPANNNRGYESPNSSSKSSPKSLTNKLPIFDVEEYNRIIPPDEINMETDMCDLVPITTELVNKQNIFSVTRPIKDIQKSIHEIVDIGLNNNKYPICVSLVFVIMGFMTVDELNDEYETQKKIQRGRTCSEIIYFLEKRNIITRISYFNFGGNESKLIDHIKTLLPVGGITPIIQSGSICGHIGLLIRMAKDEIYYIDAMDNSAFLLSAEDNAFIKYLQKYRFNQNTIGFLLTPDTWSKQGKKRKIEEQKIIIRKQKTKRHRK